MCAAKTGFLTTTHIWWESCVWDWQGVGRSTDVRDNYLSYASQRNQGGKQESKDKPWVLIYSLLYTFLTLFKVAKGGHMVPSDVRKLAWLNFNCLKKKTPTSLFFILQSNLTNIIVVFLFLQTCHDENSHTTAQLLSAWPPGRQCCANLRELRVTFPDRFKVLPAVRKTNIYLCHIDEWRGAVILPHFSSSSQPGVKVHAGASEENICVSLWSVSLL